MSYADFRYLCARLMDLLARSYMLPSPCSSSRSSDAPGKGDTPEGPGVRRAPPALPALAVPISALYLAALALWGGDSNSRLATRWCVLWKWWVLGAGRRGGGGVSPGHSSSDSESVSE